MTHKIKRCFWLVIILTLLILAVCGCGQRQMKYYEYDELTQTHKQWEYKSNRIFMAEQIEGVFIDIPDKGKVWVGPYKIDPDDVKAGYGLYNFGTTGGAK
jgi:hypothetical protein